MDVKKSQLRNRIAGAVVAASLVLAPVMVLADAPASWVMKSQAKAKKKRCARGQRATTDRRGRSICVAARANRNIARRPQVAQAPRPVDPAWTPPASPPAAPPVVEAIPVPPSVPPVAPTTLPPPALPAPPPAAPPVVAAAGGGGLGIAGIVAAVAAAGGLAVALGSGGNDSPG